MKHWKLMILSLIVLVYGCDKEVTNPVEATTNLTEEEQMEIIASEIAADNGGVMADIQSAGEAANGGYGMEKAAAFDTSFSNDWINYSLELTFYNENGREQALYIKNKTDKIVYKSQLSGHYDSKAGRQSISLNRSTTLEVAGIIDSVLTFNGSSTNTSDYEYTGLQTNLNVNSESTIDVENLVINLTDLAYLPTSGKIEATLTGNYTKDGVASDKTVDYSFNFKIEFNGSSQVKVTLNSGTTFTLDLQTGEISD